MDTRELQKWINENNIRERTLKSFWKCFEYSRIEYSEEFLDHFGEFKMESLSLRIEKFALVIKNWEPFHKAEVYKQEYVETYITLEYKDTYTGYYCLIFDLSGDIVDDYLVYK